MFHFKLISCNSVIDVSILQYFNDSSEVHSSLLPLLISLAAGIAPQPRHSEQLAG